MPIAQSSDRTGSRCQSNADLLRELLADSWVLLRRQAQKHSQLPDDAEEALQSALALFIERYAGRGEPLAWLQTTVKREAWRIAKRAYRRRELGISAVPRRDGGGTIDLSDRLLSVGADPADLAEADETYNRRRAAIDGALKPDERIALLLLGYGYSYTEIAELRGWTHTKVNRCLSEGRAALRATDQASSRVAKPVIST